MFVLFIVFVVLTVVAGALWGYDIPRTNSGYSTLASVLLVLVIYSTIFIAIRHAENRYKQGQIHILSGKPAEYRLVEHEDKTTTWEEIE